MKSIGVVTVGRSDYGSCLPLLRGIQDSPELTLQLFVSGAHLLEEYGDSVEVIKADGFSITDEVSMLCGADTSLAIAQAIGRGTQAFAESFSRFQPDLILVVGDRFELLSVASAALPLRIPIAHVSGGEITEGAIDNQIRHAVTKMSHLHFVSNEEHAQRVLQMGEEPWRVTVTGEPALDLLHSIDFLTRDELSQELELDLNEPLALVTYHPTTLCGRSSHEEIDMLTEALQKHEMTAVITYPNADADNREIIERLKSFVKGRANTRLVQTLGNRKYYSLMRVADIMIGNSSSGIWEAPSFCLPVVNIGDRQAGRLRADNVIDVDCNTESICQGIDTALSTPFCEKLTGTNPYGDGNAAKRILDILSDLTLGQNLIQKRFTDYKFGEVK